MPPQMFSLFYGDNCFFNVMLIFVLPPFLLLFCMLNVNAIWKNDEDTPGSIKKIKIWLWGANSSAGAAENSNQISG